EGTIVTFDGSASTDNVGIVNYTWTFNDGTGNITLYGVGPSHLFTTPGDHTITLNVTNAATYWDSDSMELTVDPIKDETDEESKSNYFLLVLGMILLVVIIFGILSVVILVRSRKGLLDEE
ncbi:MAG: PKD domain-containing protein, partial [Candidatus Thermoplasmatota archaeon]|nr:PKD domain-containing protein [Candidatus Thermoplasmatota archaeon]